MLKRKKFQDSWLTLCLHQKTQEIKELNKGPYKVTFDLEFLTHFFQILNLNICFVHVYIAPIFKSQPFSV